MRTLIASLALMICLPPSTAHSTTKRRMKCDPGEVMVGITNGKKVLCQSIFEVLQEAIEEEAQSREPSDLSPLMRRWVTTTKRQGRMQARRSNLPLRSGPKEGLSTHRPGTHPTTCVTTTSNGTIVVDRTHCMAMFAGLGDPARLSTQARVVPHYRGGHMRGWKLVGVRPGTLFRELGFKSGDVLVSVNGKDMPSLSHVVSLLTELKRAQTVQIEILRRTMTKKLKVTLVGPTVP